MVHLKNKMEKYLIEKKRMILIDTELGLHFEEHFDPQLLPQKKVSGKKLSSGHRIQKSGEEWFLEKEEKHDGQALFFYPSGEIKMELYYSQGQLHGPSTFYSENGQILSKRWFIQNQLQGKSWEYYLNGALYSVQQFVNGVWHGKQDYFYLNGNSKTIMTYEHGILEGTVLLYTMEGRLEREITFVHGKRSTENKV